MIEVVPNRELIIEWFKKNYQTKISYDDECLKYNDQIVIYFNKIYQADLHDDPNYCIPKLEPGNQWFLWSKELLIDKKDLHDRKFHNKVDELL